MAKHFESASPADLNGESSYLRDTLLVLSAEKDGPGNAAWVLALEEEGLGLSILETENLRVTTDVELALQSESVSDSVLVYLVPSYVLNVELSNAWRSNRLCSFLCLHLASK
jgi:hypothetical protein